MKTRRLEWVLSGAMSWAVACSGSDGADQPAAAGVSGPQGGTGASAGTSGGSAAGNGVQTGAAGVGGTAGASGQSGEAGGSGAGGQNGEAGQAGTQAIPPPNTCTDTDSSFDPFGGGETGSPHLRKGTATGTNGTFEDACDDAGNLIEQTCATSFGCSAPPGADCAPREMRTGEVIAHTIDCLGSCADGACNLPCPALDDELVVSFVTSMQRFALVPDAGELRYLCLREQECETPRPTGPVRLTVTELPFTADESERDCLMNFSEAFSPLRLSDGCGYHTCSTALKDE